MDIQYNKETDHNVLKIFIIYKYEDLEVPFSVRFSTGRFRKRLKSPSGVRFVRREGFPVPDF